MPEGLIPGSQWLQNAVPSELTKPSLHLVPQNQNIKKRRNMLTSFDSHVLLSLVNVLIE